MFQLVLIGEHGAGKTTLCQALIGSDPTSNSPPPTMGASKFDLHVPNFQHKLALWDTAGFEQYNSLSHIYYRNSSLALLVFDSSVSSSLSAVPQWVSAYREDPDRASNPIILIANKIDLPRAVSADAARACATANGCSYAEVSALEGKNVSDLKSSIAEALQNLKPIEIEPELRYHQRVKNVECC